MGGSLRKRPLKTKMTSTTTGVRVVLGQEATDAQNAGEFRHPYNTVGLSG